MAVRSTFSSDERGHKSASLIRKLSQREPLTGESWFSLVDGQQKMNSVTFSEVFFMLICLLMFFFLTLQVSCFYVMASYFVF